jgi:hypothetical protein
MAYIIVEENIPLSISPLTSPAVYLHNGFGVKFPLKGFKPKFVIADKDYDTKCILEI